MANLPLGKWMEFGKFDCGKSLNISSKSNLQWLLDIELTLTVASERPKSSGFVPATIFRYNYINFGALPLAFRSRFLYFLVNTFVDFSYILSGGRFLVYGYAIFTIQTNAISI